MLSGCVSWVLQQWRTKSANCGKYWAQILTKLLLFFRWATVNAIEKTIAQRRLVYDADIHFLYMDCSEFRKMTISYWRTFFYYYYYYYLTEVQRSCQWHCSQHHPPPRQVQTVWTIITIFEPRQEKTFGFSKCKYHTIWAVNNKGADQTVRMQHNDVAQLCLFVISHQPTGECWCQHYLYINLSRSLVDLYQITSQTIRNWSLWLTFYTYFLWYFVKVRPIKSQREI